MTPRLYDIDTPGSKNFCIKRNEGDEWEPFSVDEFMFFLQHVEKIDAYDPDKQIAVAMDWQYDAELGSYVPSRAYTYSAAELMREIKLDSTSRLYEDFVELKSKTKAI
jgi:hypothetical protein